jgi:uncharacterized integral membrane protein
MTQADRGHEISPSPDTRERTSRIGFGAILSLVGIGLLLTFVLQNTTSIDVDFLFWTFTWPVWFLIAVSAVLGATAWFGMGLVRRHRRRALRRENRRR